MMLVLFFVTKIPCQYRANITIQGSINGGKLGQLTGETYFITA